MGSASGADASGMAKIVIRASGRSRPAVPSIGPGSPERGEQLLALLIVDHRLCDPLDPRQRRRVDRRNRGADAREHELRVASPDELPRYAARTPRGGEPSSPTTIVTTIKRAHGQSRITRSSSRCGAWSLASRDRVKGRPVTSGTPRRGGRQRTAHGSDCPRIVARRRERFRTSSATIESISRLATHAA